MSENKASKKAKDGGAGAPSKKPMAAPPAKLRNEDTGDFSLLDYVTSGTLTLPRRHRDQRAFLRFLKRASTDPELRDAIERLRDNVILSALKAKQSGQGLTIAITGCKGGEGASFIALVLALSLGGCTHHRIAVLDGRFNLRRFGALSDMLGLAQNSVCLKKGQSELVGYFNERHPNVYFLKNTGRERGLQFFSDKELDVFFADLRRTFDFTIIDMPPLLKETSNIFVAPCADQLYLVVAAGTTKLAEVGRAMEVAQKADAKIAGVVVNKQKAPWWSRFFWREFFF